MRDRRGFTLLEAAVAAAIVGLAAVAALAAFGAELRASGSTRRALAADALAADRLARVRLLSAAELDPLPDSLRLGHFSAPFADYRWEVRSERVHGADHLFNLVVTIGWPDGSYALATRTYKE